VGLAASSPADDGEVSVGQAMPGLGRQEGERRWAGLVTGRLTRGGQC
jgi:hypothetical protein